MTKRDVLVRIMPQNSKKRGKSELFQIAWQVGLLTTVPFILVAGPLIGFLAGDWFDRKYHSAPYGKTILIVLGIVGAVREIIQIIRRVLKP